MKNKKGNETNTMIVLAIVIILIFIAGFKYMQYKQELKTINPYSLAVTQPNCPLQTDSACTKDNCERTYGQWIGCNAPVGVCQSCICAGRTIGWQEGFGCYYRISSKQT